MLKEKKLKLERKQRRIKRIRRKIFGTLRRPRLAVTKTNRQIFAQIIDDNSGKTLAAVSTLKITKGSKTEQAASAGDQLARTATKAKITQVVFDRRGFKFHGRVKAFAEAAKRAGLKF